jgi:sugar/nucleoside kinase (ribokinase family)
MKQKNGRTRSAKPSIIGTGLIAMDVLSTGDDPQLPKRWAGGTCGNVLTILSYLGWNSFPVTRLNGETASRRVLRDLKRWSVNLDFARCQPRADTPIIIHKIIRNENGEAVHRFSLKCPHCGSWLPTFRPITVAAANKVSAHIETPKVFFFDRVSPGSMILAKDCAAKGALIVFEPASIDKEDRFKEALSLAHIVKYSSERLEDIQALGLKEKPLIEIETQGEHGLRYRSGLPSSHTNKWHNLAPYRTASLKDAAGAGDWCTAGIISRLGKHGLKGLLKTGAKELQAAIQYGQALAAWNCGFEGARGGMYEVDQQTFRRQVRKIEKQGSPSLSADAHNPDLRRDGSLRQIRVLRPADRPPSPSRSQDACCF